MKLNFAAAIASAGFAGIASAHHAINIHFDMRETLEMDGIVTETQIVNPHAYLYFDVTDEDGSVTNWRCEMWSGTGLRRRGWNEETIRAGQRVRVNGSPARREENHCLLNVATLESGLELTSASVIGDTTIASVTELGDPLADPPATLGGKPNLSGYWVRSAAPGVPEIGGVPLFGGPPGTAPVGGLSGMGPVGGGGRGAGGGLPGDGVEPTAAGAAAVEGFEFVFDVPAVHCHPTNILFAMTHDTHVNRFVHHADSLAITYGYMDLERRVDLSAPVHPDDTRPSTAGYSIGHWEGDTLVVDTLGFDPGYLIASPARAVAHGAGMRITERFSLSEDRSRLTRTYEATDPEYFTGTHSGTDTFNRSSEPYFPYDCTELSGRNNRRPETN